MGNNLVAIIVEGARYEVGVFKNLYKTVLRPLCTAVQSFLRFLQRETFTCYGKKF